MIMAINGAAPILPIGFVFAPEDKEIIGFFLKHLVTIGPPFPPRTSCFLHNLDIYGPHPPWDIAESLPEEQRNDFYVFTKLKKLTPGRSLRTAKEGQGTWKGQSVGIPIAWAGVVGEKKSYSFLYGKNKLTSHWNLYEYNLLKIDGIPVLDDSEGGRWVICRVIYNKNLRKKSCVSSCGPIEESVNNQTTKKRKVPQQVLRIGSDIAGTPQHGAGEESGNMFDITNQNVLSADMGGIQEDQSFAADQPTAAVEEQELPPFVDDSDRELAEWMEAIIDADPEVPSAGTQGYQDQVIHTIENVDAGFNEQETIFIGQSTSDNANEFQQLLYNPAAVVEAEQELMEQQFTTAYNM